MSAVAAMRLPLDVDLSAFVALLQRVGLPHRVSEEGGEQVLWVPDAALVEQVRALYVQYPQGDGAVAAIAPRTGRLNIWAQVRRSPASAVVLLLTFIVFALTWGGENLQTVGWLSFVEFQMQGQQVYLNYLPATFASGQWWRLVTPILIHFGWLHLAMNSLWFWELGRRVEFLQGAVSLLGLIVLLALASNFAQYWWSGPSVFGGLSGVLYGLLGHCWIYQKLAPNPIYRLPPGVLVLMLVWLVICMSGVFEALQIGAIANGAHVGGLLAGCVTGLLSGALARRPR